MQMRQGTRQGPRIAANDRGKELNQEMKHITRRGQARKGKERRGEARNLAYRQGTKARNEHNQSKERDKAQGKDRTEARNKARKG